MITSQWQAPGDHRKRKRLGNMDQGQVKLVLQTTAVQM